ncbi:MAG: hypothetical protein ABF384_00565 [Verrucomicrobiales bacterium]
MRYALLLILPLLLLGCERKAPEAATANSPAENGTILSFPKDDSFLPQDWKVDPISAQITPIAPAEIAKATEILEAGLAKYPSAVLSRFLKKVRVVGSLRFYDVGYGGTYMANGNEVVLVYRSSFDDRGFEQRFHHEFSSLLLKMNESRFEDTRWHAANEASFVYRATGIIEEQSGEKSEATQVLEDEQKKTGGSGSNLLKLNPELMKQGFLTAYNQVSLEQDLNETAAHLFTNPNIWDYTRAHPRIDHKVDVLIDFYRTLDPALDRVYFRQLTDPEKP